MTNYAKCRDWVLDQVANRQPVKASELNAVGNEAEPEKEAEEAKEEDWDADLNALGKGTGKAGGKGQKFQGTCFNCGKVGHKRDQCWVLLGKGSFGKGGPKGSAPPAWDQKGWQKGNGKGASKGGAGKAGKGGERCHSSPSSEEFASPPAPTTASTRQMRTGAALKV